MLLSLDRPSRLSAAEPAPTPRVAPTSADAFTILEILVVLAILGLLAGLLFNGLSKNFGAAKVSVARIFVQQTARTPLTRYSIDIGSFPTTEEGMAALLKAPSDKADRWQGPYMDSPNGKVPLDPWGHEYKYVSPGVRNKDGYDLWSVGPDGVDGTPDDVGNW